MPSLTTPDQLLLPMSHPSPDFDSEGDNPDDLVSVILEGVKMLHERDDNAGIMATMKLQQNHYA